jgi:hypothetical protein
MPFQFPADVKETIQSGKRAGEPLSKATIGIYRSRLNRFADYGISSLEHIMKRPKATIATINTLARNDMGSTDGLSDEEVAKRLRQAKRNYYNALFYIMPKKITDKSNAFYVAFQATKEPYTPA